MEPEMVYGTDPQPITRIASVAGPSPEILVVRWQGGAIDHINLSGWIAGGPAAFQRLRDRAVFASAAVVDHGTGVQWAGDDDLVVDAAHLAMLAEQQRPFEARDLAAWQERMKVSNQEAADLLGVRLSTWHNYKNGHNRIPRGVQIACRATERDPVIFEAHYRPRTPGRPPAA